ncbi:hypothetical protein L1987_15827 [Smallanthus sonchifolius]|uniref:Uncharacterized protein n=1 Tax=Smallanthus sonchifolius TaxID=185202 RepID=A0ACB9J7N5_9ASTR|nr:hypothetical protein L1987_15827 [Smallanthus sonchifolius]
MATAATPPPTTAASELNMYIPTNQPLLTRIRLAANPDVPAIHKMIYQMAAFQRLADQCFSTESSLSTTLFSKDNHFESFTVFLIEVSTKSFPSSSAAHHPEFTPIHKTLNVHPPVSDPEPETFKSSTMEDEVFVAGFVLFFPNYTMSVAKPGFYIQDLFVRKSYRRMGLGKMLLAVVARQAVEMGYGRVEWVVLDWNTNAIKFYEEMGAYVVKEWMVYRLISDGLQAFAATNDLEK